MPHLPLHTLKSAHSRAGRMEPEQAHAIGHGWPAYDARPARLLDIAREAAATGQVADVTWQAARGPAGPRPCWPGLTPTSRSPRLLSASRITAGSAGSAAG